MAQQGTGKVNQTLSYPKNVTQARYKGKKRLREKEITTLGG